MEQEGVELRTVVSEELPVGEQLEIRKLVVGPGGGARVCVVTGIHGDELEGQYVCYELARRLRQAPGRLQGTVEVWPAVNPLGVDSVSRGIPTFDLDMNRIFPGQGDGHMVERVAGEVVSDLRGADMVMDIHASNVFLYELPQARISEQTAARLVPWARLLNLEFIWVHEAATVLESTLAHSLNAVGTPCVVVEMGIGMRITREYGDALVDGIFNMLSELGVWQGPRPTGLRAPRLSTSGEVRMINAPASGVMVAAAQHGAYVSRGDRLCQIVDPLTGTLLSDVLSPVDGLLFTIRAYPIVYEGSLLARIFSD